MKNKLYIILIMLFLLYPSFAFAVTDEDIKNGVVMWWNTVNTTGNISGSTILDKGPLKNNGTITGINCTSSYCSLLSGNIAFSSKINLSTQTIYFIFDLTSTADTPLLGLTTDGNNFAIEMNYPTAGKIGTYFGGSATSSTASFAANTGIHRGMLIQNANILSYMMNGTNVTNAAAANLGGSYISNQYIGRGDTTLVDGYLYLIAIWNRSLTTDEIAYLQTKGNYYDPYAVVGDTNNYTIFGNITYNNTIFANANVSLLSAQGVSVLATRVSNATGGYIFADLTNNTYYGISVFYSNTTALLSASGYVLMNMSVNITKNLDFYSTGTSSTTVYPNCFIFNNGCYAYTTLTSNNCAIIGR